jgi:hypothetical protein
MAVSFQIADAFSLVRPERPSETQAHSRRLFEAESWRRLRRWKSILESGGSLNYF